MLKDENGNIIELSYKESDMIGRGTYGKVFRINRDTCYKKFLCIDNALTLENLLKLKSWSCYPSLYTIKNLCFNNDVLVGYIMKYYESLDIRELTKRYIYNSYLRCMELIDKVSSDGYLLTDLHGGNIIMEESGIVLIDCDDMDKSTKSKEKLLSMNEENLRYAIGFYLQDTAFMQRLGIDRVERIFKELISSDISTFNTDEPIIKVYR